MKVLALECSTREHSAAVLDDDRTLATVSWQPGREGNAALFNALAGVLAKAGLSPEAIELFAVGVGPGSFTGIRSAIAAMRAMALPEGRPVVGVNSAQATAYQALKLPSCAGAHRVAVVGDARRNKVWLASFNTKANVPMAHADIQLVPLAAIGTAFAPGTVVVSPGDSRLAEAIQTAAAISVVNLPPPTAATIGRLALQAMATGSAPMPPLPLYLHEAV